MRDRALSTLVLLCGLFVFTSLTARSQMQQSGGSGGSTNLTQVGGTSFALGQAAMSGSLPVAIASNQSALAVTGTFWQSTQPVSLSALPALVGGTANIGIVRSVPSSCTQSTNFAQATSQVATGAGTTVTSTTTCITFAYANNITNSSVTLRL